MTLAQKSMVAYGLGMLALGVQAFFFPFAGHKSSLPSLLGGGGVGLIVLVLGILASKAANPRWHYIASLALALVGSSRFIGNLFKGQFAWYPGGVVLLLSLGLIAILGMGHMMAMKNRSASAE
ncbi:MAG: hypothetical protein JNM28_07165 [Armatimonadetes bacterium]|nr:hypothetical protein [Armatimonadota bacterium]